MPDHPRVEGLRAQYHFMPEADGDGRMAWDIHRLIHLAADLPVEEVAVESIPEIDTNHWFDEHHRPTVRSVIEHLARRARIRESPGQPGLATFTGASRSSDHPVSRVRRLVECRIESPERESF